MKILKKHLVSLWYEDRKGNKYYPTKKEMRGLFDPKKPLIYQLSHFPNVLHETMLKLIFKGGHVNRSVRVLEGSSSWSQDLVLAMYYKENPKAKAARFKRTGKYDLFDCITIAAKACERCMNALAHKYGLKWGYLEGSKEWRICGTTCQFCDHMYSRRKAVRHDVKTGAIAVRGVVKV